MKLKKFKDLILKNKESIFYFRYLEWDSNFFNKPSYILDINKSNLIPTHKMKYKIINKLKKAFVSVKIDASVNYKVIKFLQECGFKYIDTEVELEYINKYNPVIHTKINKNIIVEKVSTNQKLPYKKLGNSFSLTRFHTDDNINDKLADKLWVEYLKNFKSSNKKNMFIARYKKSIVGVILINIDKETNIANLFFVAVLKEFQGLGVGQTLIQQVINKYSPKYKLTTGTQVKNINALNFYIKNGLLSIIKTRTVLHL